MVAALVANWASAAGSVTGSEQLWPWQTNAALPR
jgi:hypothetical protein